jgi:hypothetical protein
MATQGTWYLPGYGYLPDFGLTEAANIGSGVNWQNPQIPYSQTAQDIAQTNAVVQQALPSTQYLQQISQQGISNTPQTQTQTQPQGGSSPSGETPSWLNVGDTFSNSQGVWRKTSTGWEFLGTHEQRAAEQQNVEKAAINDIYSPLFSALEQQKQAYEAQLPEQEKLVEQQVAKGLEGIGSQESEAKSSLGKQETAMQEAESNAYQQARQLYNELAQRYGAMFGSRTSAGPFAMEILGRETQGRFGDIQKTATQGMQSIAEEKTKLNTWVNTQKNEWERKKTEALTSLRNAFTQAISQINSQRGSLESQKARDRYAALTDAQNRQAAIQQADAQFKQQLALFQAQKESQLTTTPTYTTGTGGYLAANTLGQPFSVSTIGTTATTNGSSNYAPSGTYTWEYDPATGQRRKIPSYVISQNY